ncbi:hypothetical protein [Helicobacter cappadocius]|uniref:Uncharacterized protein n=1 Tax=Helicobacter cappadocius TaxID=3063998 RepID=A0AA90PPX4_9HELI|nr:MULTISPECIES: hypothetical protein [unclassified Helicobacter]MDO7252674.1 hypothetical protein [Helicobacter sp. faydin-H75]MDP2538541.1 hypothetical protein [Helicobacter sp. faydin-H76]
MKNSQSIISSIKNQTHFKKLQENSQLNKLKLVLPLGMRKAILHITYKNHRLLFAFNNPGLCAEFNNYNRNDIKESLKNHRDFFASISPDPEILGFVQHSFLPSDEENVSEIESYNEHSDGEFTNLAKNTQLYEIFESIRASILKNLKDNS